MTAGRQPPGGAHDPRRTDWANDCLHWRGRLLTGDRAHWCPDWDDLPIDETCEEWPCACASAWLREVPA
jgi:hypothetical protein